jgi:hypothetical protein
VLRREREREKHKYICIHIDSESIAIMTVCEGRWGDEKMKKYHDTHTHLIKYEVSRSFLLNSIRSDQKQELQYHEYEQHQSRVCVAHCFNIHSIKQQHHLLLLLLLLFGFLKLRNYNVFNVKDRGCFILFYVVKKESRIACYGTF